MLVCLWDFMRPVPISETTPILENRILCSPVVTGHGLFHWVMGLWFFTLYWVKIKITRIFLPDPKPKGKTRVRIWRHDFSSKPSRLLKNSGSHSRHQWLSNQRPPNDRRDHCIRNSSFCPISLENSGSYTIQALHLIFLCQFSKSIQFMLRPRPEDRK